MIKIGFSSQRRQGIMECVRSTTAIILVNRSLAGKFKLGRGLCQGDPLSPFLFLIKVGGLNVMLNASVQAGIFNAFGVGAEPGFRISYLQYADDTQILREKGKGDFKALETNLILLEIISGLRVNFHKSLLVD